MKKYTTFFCAKFIKILTIAFDSRFKKSRTKYASEIVRCCLARICDQSSTIFKGNCRRKIICRRALDIIDFAKVWNRQH